MVSGTWNLFYNFGCGSTYFSATITFNPGNVFNDNFGGQGVWFQNNGTIVFVYTNQSQPSWAGNVAGAVMTGDRIFPATKDTGCWYATQFAVQPAAITSEDKAHVAPGDLQQKRG